MKYKINDLGFPVSKYRSSNVKIIKNQNIFLLNKFFRRNINLCFQLKDFQVIKYWYLDKVLEQLILKKILRYDILIYFIKKIEFFYYFYYKFIKKKNIYYLSKKDLILLGPFSHSYSHQLHELIPRILYLEKKKIHFNVYVPDCTLPILSSKIFSKLFRYCKIKYFSSTENCVFYNTNYLTHFDNRWNCKSIKKKVNYRYKKILNLLREKLLKYKSNKYKNYKYILVSRSRAIVRNLLNEKELFNKLKKIGFKLVYFENLSFEDQISIASNCKIMVGYHGAGLTNLLFMRPRTKVFEIINKFYDHPHMEIFSKCQNIIYNKFYCLENFKNKNGICDVNLIYNYIKNKKKSENFTY